MRIVNGLVYILIVTGFVLWFRAQRGKGSATERYIKNHGYVLVCLLAVNSLSFGMTFKEKGSKNYIQKEGYLGEERQILLLLEKGEEQKEICLTVHPQKLSDEQRKKKMGEAFSYLEERIRGKNPSLENVTTDLDFALDSEKYPFEVEVCPADFTLLDEEGTVKNNRQKLLAEGYKAEELENGISTEVSVSLRYGEIREDRRYALRIFPRRESDVERLFSEVESQLKEREQEKIHDEGFLLPSTLNGVQIRAVKQEKNVSVVILVLGLVFIILMLFREQEQKKQDRQKRQNMLRRCYPWFVNELVLLLGAGMQMENIISVLLQEDEEDYRKPLIYELREAQNGLRLGVSEAQVYYRLGRRLELPCYIKLMTLLEQNVKRGTKGLMAIMEQEELAALEERKTLARRYGEEAGTKLLGPMILLLIVIMLMIMIPAFLSIG